MGAGMGWGDFDLDGFVDLYVGNGDYLGSRTGEAKLDQLFRNLAGTQFDNVTTVASPDGFGFAQGIAVGDSNRDGFEDVFVSSYGQNFLLVNQGDGSFQRQDLGSAGNEPVWKTGCIQIDLDDDGDLDIFATCYLDWTPENHHPCEYSGQVGYCGPGTYDATKDLVYENLGDGTFRMDPQALGMKESSKGLVVGALDVDGDRIPEIYVGSDLTKNRLYHRDSASKEYKNIADESGVATSKNGVAEATMGLALKDFDGNGKPDLFLTHYYQFKNTLYLNQGSRAFKDASYESRIKSLSFDYIGFGTIPVDYDCDGDFDLFIANGHVLGEHIPPFR